MAVATPHETNGFERPSANVHRDERSDAERRIYVIGSGNIGTMVAHSLASLPDETRPPITLLLHRQSLMDTWKARGETLDLLRYPDGAHQPQGGIDVELVEHETANKPRSLEVQAPEEPIHNLIVSVLASQTNSALDPIRHRLGPQSSILFLQNGMGSADDAAHTFFPDPETRPTFLIGIVYAGAFQVQPFVVRHAGPAKLLIGVAPRSSPAHLMASDPRSASAQYVLDLMLASPVLQASEVDYTELRQTQLEKLACNAVVNPVSALLDQPIGIVERKSLGPLVRAMSAEMSSIIRALPELQDVPGAYERFSPERVETTVMGNLAAVRASVSSMTQHLRHSKKTEIDYIDGYLVRRANELSLPSPLMMAVRQLILTKEAIGLEKAKAGVDYTMMYNA
jgi:2-dehydropantoate 2-reductase